MKENPLKTFFFFFWGGGGGGGDNTEIALEIHMKETERVSNRGSVQLSLQVSKLDKMICYLTFFDDQLICFICISIFVISEVFEEAAYGLFHILAIKTNCHQIENFKGIGKKIE